MKKIILFLILIFELNANILTTGMRTGLASDDILDTGKIVRLSLVTQKTLSMTSKSQNIQGLLSLAVKENKITYIDQFKYREVFQHINKGDVYLLKCLKNTKCQVSNYSKNMKASSLHQELAFRNPAISFPKTNHAVGAINENIMHKYFHSRGWQQIEGEVGRNGIDGLYIKKNSQGVIVDILVVESKYNKSGLQHTQHGKQMSTEWVLKKLDVLKNKYPNNKDYLVIEKYVQNDSYRSMLWNMKIKDDSLLISLKKVHDKQGVVITENLKGSEKMKINYANNRSINLNNPETAFHQEITNWYKQEIRAFAN